MVLATPFFGLTTETRSITGDGNNLIGTFDPSDLSGTIGTGSDLVNVDPLLTPIENSNGTVVAYAPLEGSPIINAGNNANIFADLLDLDNDENTEEPIATDQLGNQRILNDTVDIGAVEFGASSVDRSAPVTNSDVTNTVYRFFNQDAGVHFYTANETERSAVLELPNYNFEGESYIGVDPLSGMPAQPVYRFLNQDTGVHLYTISETERESVAQLDNFTFEGEVFSAYAIEQEGSIPIFRFFNSLTGAHFYTPSATERDAVEDLADFQSEGIAYYALPVSDS